ncbi:MAG: hypothetical protein HY657_03965 [Acidobacteria bacterium]|nr:hypothetical protein [Acidobacteriota bacterium]
MSTHPHMAEALEILRFQSDLTGRTGPDLADVYRRVVTVLDRLGAKWTLVGAHAVNVYVRPRATVDVDFIVDGRMLKRILAELEAEFGALETTDIGAALRITNLSIDLIRSDNHPLFRAALDQAQERGGPRVPPPELLVTLKFLSAVSPWRKPGERKQDAADLINVYQSAGAEFDRQSAVQYSSAVYPGAERDFAAMLDRIDRGEDVQL